MIFHENKVELSLTWEKLPIREAMSNELGTFQKVQEKNANKLELWNADLSVPVLDAGGKPSTRFPPGRLVELSRECMFPSLF